jgi:site-specific DNA-methyltransferase (adenine-specific)
MKFDVIVGNPPYQLADGGSGPSASPLYHRFVQQAKKLMPRFISMIIPSRWFAGGKGLDEFRDEMLNDNRINVIVDFPNSADCFEGVDIAGGVNYFLWSQEYSGDCMVRTIRGGSISEMKRPLNEYDIFVRSNESLSIIRKVEKSNVKKMDEIVLSRNPFGFASKDRGQRKESKSHYIKLIHSQGNGFVSEGEVLKNIDLVPKWKVSIGKLVPSNGEVGVDPSKGYNAMTQPRLMLPNEVITDSYLVLATFNTENEARNFEQYMKLKTPRFLMHETYSSMNISRSNFRFVPFLDYNKKWSDEIIYEMFGFTDKEINFIEGMIRSME